MAQTKKAKSLAGKLGENQKLYGVAEAIQLLKDLKTTKFDEDTCRSGQNAVSENAGSARNARAFVDRSGDARQP